MKKVHARQNVFAKLLRQCIPGTLTTPARRELQLTSIKHMILLLAVNHEGDVSGSNIFYINFKLVITSTSYLLNTFER